MNRSCLLDFCSGFLGVIEQEEASDFLADEQDQLIGKVKGLYQSAKQFSRCIAYLFEVKVAGPPCTAQDVLQVISFKGSDPFLQATKSILTQPEPVDTARGPTGQNRVSSRDMLQELVRDVTKTAASSVTLQPIFESCGNSVAELQRKLDNDELFQQDFGPTLMNVLENLPKLASGMRRNATVELYGVPLPAQWTVNS